MTLTDAPSRSNPTSWLARHRVVLTTLIFAGALLATIPPLDDIGLTWDEPSYRTSQVVSAEWWARLGRARSRADLADLVTPEALHHYWPYARFGYNFHPPLAGQLSLLTHALTGRWLKDIPSRRLASAVEFAATVALLGGFVSRRSGVGAGLVAAGSLLTMPRVFGDGQVAGTDMPGLLLWAVAALAFWRGLEPGARRWRLVVGLVLGLAFLEKMAAVMVLGPILVWLAATRLPRAFRRGGGFDWLDAAITLGAMLGPLGLAFREVLRLARVLPPPAQVDLASISVRTELPQAILLVPLLVWTVRRAIGSFLPQHPLWGRERPGLETLASILAVAPAVGLAGNPGWWRDTLVRMAHYYQLNADRRGALPDIRILYQGEIYTYSLPWANAWVLIALTVPLGLLIAAGLGVIATLKRTIRRPPAGRGRDWLPAYFALHLAFPPLLRMLPTPAHDGVRLILPTFFFLAAFAGWGAVAVGARLERIIGPRGWATTLVAAGLLGSSAGQLILVHPFELSYYNELAGGPRGAWRSGYELTYWYDAFNRQTLDAINRELPPGAAVDFLNELINTPTMACLQELGALRGDLVLGAADPDRFPHGWMLTHDSKATPVTRLLFAMTPLYARCPRQLDGLRVATVATPEAVARAWALDVLTRGSATRTAQRAPDWVHRLPASRLLARFWGEGLTYGPPLGVDPAILDRARRDPVGLLADARAVASGRPVSPGNSAAQFRAFLDRRVGPAPEDRLDWRTAILLRNRPEALVEAAEILIRHPDAVRALLLRSGFTDPTELGGWLDRDLPDVPAPRLIDRS